ncbi:MAG: helix-turn-helix domain-containing protein [Candidatus Aenigmatarchaeota archaeon]
MTSDKKDSFEVKKENLTKKICGEIILSDKPNKTIKKWRNIFEISQRDLADQMDIMPSVISDYESGRRKSPGIKMVRKIVNGLIEIDERRGGNVLMGFSNLPSNSSLSKSLLDIREFSVPVKIKDFCEKTGIDIVSGKEMTDKEIYGYSIIDSLKAIVELSPQDMVKLYGLTSQRALIFTRVSTGRSPMVAIKVTNLKPSLVAFHGLNKVDKLAKRIADVERIPVGICRKNTTKEIISTLKENF